MKKKVSLIVILLILMFNLTGCLGPGMNDYNYEMSNHYIVWRASTNSVSIEKDEDGDGAIIGGSIVPEKVIKVAWDDTFILAEQIHLIENTQELDETKIYFWIINSMTDEVYGPLSKAEFDLKRDELHIDSSLKLEDPEKFKYLRDEQNINKDKSK